MIRHPLKRRPIAVFVSLACLSSLSGLAQAGGFALIEHGASGMGNAYAGAAAVSQDASTVWFNPAGMSHIEGRQVAIGVHVLKTDSAWTDTGTTLGARLGRAATSGSDTANPGTTSALPNFYYVAPINDKWNYGLSIGAPYGSSTEYDRDWKGRYTTVKSGIKVIDINPAISYNVSDKVRLGFGISFQQLTAELGSAVDSGGACLAFASRADTSFNNPDCVNAGLTPGVQENDGYAEIAGDSTTFGFNLGALFMPNEAVKIGVAYRHSMSHELEGDVDFDVNADLRGLLDANTDTTTQLATQGFLRDGGVSAEVDLPATFSVSAAWQANNKLELLGDITWTGWSSFQELRVVYDSPAQPDTLSVQEWKDVMRYSVGLNYQSSNKLTLRAGLAFDEEAIPSAQRRTARIPGNDRTWLSFGAGYNINNKVSLDVGYAHLFLDETAIDNSDPESAGASQEVRGLYDPGVDILSAQINWAFN